MMLEVTVENDGEWDSRSGWADLVRNAAEAAIAESAFPQLATSERPVELSVRLADDEEVRSLNAKWRGKDKPTNVLSFPQLEREELDQLSEGPDLLLGDLILAHGVCAREAGEKGISVEDHATHLIVHGTLHLLGYDHMDDDSAEEMETREVRALARLGVADPYEVRD